MPFGIINPDGRTPTKKKKSTPKKKTVNGRLQDSLDFMRKLTRDSNTAGGSFGGSTGGYAKGWRPGVTPPKTQGGYAKGWRPGTPAAPKKSNGGYAKGWQAGHSPVGAGARGVNGAGGGSGYGAVSAYVDPFGFGGGGGDPFQQIMEGILGSGQMEIPDAAEMAKKQFDPQYDLLNQIRSQTTGRMNKQAQDAQAMYDALGQQFEGDKSGVTAQYDQAAQSLDAAFGGARSAVQQTGDNSGAEMRAMMNKLGITEAAPAAIANIDEDQARSLNTIAEMQANYAGANEASENSMLDYLTAESNTMGVAGANARADVERMLQQALEGYSNKELELKAAQQAAENEYAMGIADMQQDAQQAAMEQARWGAEFGFQQQQWGADQAFRNNQFQTEQDRWNQEFQWGRTTDT